MDNNIINQEPEQGEMFARVGAEIGPITVTQEGAVISPSATAREIEDAMANVARVSSSCRWAIADLADAYAGKFGEKYARLASVTGLEQGTIRTLAWVGRAIPQHMRRQSLSMRHHRAVAGLTDDLDKDLWLNQAEDMELSAARLEASIKAGRVLSASEIKGIEQKGDAIDGQEQQEAMQDPQQPQSPQQVAQQVAPQSQPSQPNAGQSSFIAPYPAPVEGGALRNIHSHVNALVVYLSKFRQSGKLDDLDESEIYNLHLDLLPVILQYGKTLRMARGKTPALADKIAEDLEEAGMRSDNL